MSKIIALSCVIFAACTVEAAIFSPISSLLKPDQVTDVFQNILNSGALEQATKISTEINSKLTDQVKKLTENIGIKEIQNADACSSQKLYSEGYTAIGKAISMFGSCVTNGTEQITQNLTNMKNTLQQEIKEITQCFTPTTVIPCMNKGLQNVNAIRSIIEQISHELTSYLSSMQKCAHSVIYSKVITELLNYAGSCIKNYILELLPFY